MKTTGCKPVSFARDTCFASCSVIVVGSSPAMRGPPMGERGRRTLSLAPRRTQTRRSGSAAAHEPADGRHQLAGPRVLLGVRPIDDAVARVVVEEPERDLVERRLHRGDLRHDVDAVAVVLDHSLDAADLPFDAAQTLEQLVLGRAVAAGLARSGHATHYTPTGCR